MRESSYITMQVTFQQGLTSRCVTKSENKKKNKVKQYCDIVRLSLNKMSTVIV